VDCKNSLLIGNRIKWTQPSKFTYRYILRRTYAFKLRSPAQSPTLGVSLISCPRLLLIYRLHAATLHRLYAGSLPSIIKLLLLRVPHALACIMGPSTSVCRSFSNNWTGC
jgi:hypothetical protein